MRRYSSSVAFLLGLLALGCSDVSGPGAVDLPEGVVGGSLLHATLRSVGANTNVAVIPGDDANGIAYRSTLGFDLTKIPSHASVTQATLTVTQCRVGGDPFGVLGALVVDQINLTGGLSDAAYAGLTLSADIGTLSSTPAIGARTLDVTAQVRADRDAGRRVTAYRLRYASHDTNNDAVSDYVQVALPRDGICDTSPAPRLHVEYNR